MPTPQTVAVFTFYIMINTQISIFKDCKSPANPYNKTIGYFLDRIKNGSKATENVLKFRETKDEQYKKMLPAATLSGVFSYRSKNKLTTYSQFAVIDFDKFGTITDAKAIKENIAKDPCCFSAFISPSGKGVKAIIRTKNEPEKYESYYRAICKKYADVHLDSKTKDISRLCFESYDPDIYINENANEWGEEEEEPYTTMGYVQNTVIVPLKSESRIIEKLQKWFDTKYNMSNGERSNNLYKFACSLNAFGINQITAENYLLKYAQKGFDSNEIKSIVKSAYNRLRNEFNTRCFEDVETKIFIDKAINSGKKIPEIKKELEAQNNPISHNAETFSEVMEKVKNNDDASVFWKYDHNGKIEIIPHKFERYLKENDFCKFYPESSSDTFIFVKKDSNLIEESNNYKIKDYVLNDLRYRENLGFAPFDYMAKNTKFFSNEFLNMIESVDIEIKKDTEKTCYLYYKNYVVEVGIDYIKKIDYIDIDKYVWKNCVINRDFIEFDHHKSEFRSFLWYIAGEDQHSYNCFKSAAGYLMHSYKTTTDNKAIILNDELISDMPNGRSGKGLFFTGLKHLKKVNSIDGKDFSFEKNFKFQTVSTDCQVLVFDDVKRNFEFERLFSVITEGIEIEYKNQGTVKLPVEKSPKIIITTNYTINGEGGSFEARKHELELSAYFNSNYTPEDKFGHRLFDQWDKNEWARFDNFMIQCIQYYLQHGLVKQKHKNLELRKMIGETSTEFYEWCKDGNLRLNYRWNNVECFNAFVEANNDYKNKLTQKTFKRWIKTYCNFSKLIYADGTFNNQRYFIISETEQQKKEEEQCPF